VPDLHFRVEGAEVLEFAAVPTLLFKLRLENREGEPVRSVALNTQIRIVTTQRHYRAEEQARLGEVFGAPQRWGDTLKSLVWTHTVVFVPPFTGSTVVEMPVTCTYDFEVVSAKYLHTLEDGEIPLEFLFSGTIFYRGEDGALQIVQISWEKEVQFRLPVCVWQQMMAHYFPSSAWLRVQRDTFDRLYEYKVRTGLPTWEAALEQLLRASAEGMVP
jgi:hypothetical protein